MQLPTETHEKPSRNSRLKIRLGDAEIDVPYGTSVGEVLTAHGDVESDRLLAAVADRRCVDLDYPLWANGEVRPITYAMREGVLVYRRTASLILLEAARRQWGPVDISIGQALSNGYVYEVHREGEKQFLPEAHAEPRPRCGGW